ncbi:MULTISPECIES: hypothetical protein [unclassified Microcoleus]
MRNIKSGRSQKRFVVRTTVGTTNLTDCGQLTEHDINPDRKSQIANRK